MKEKRFLCTATVVGNKIYIVGGEEEEDPSNIHSSCEVFSTLTNTYSIIPDMKKHRSGCQAVSIGSSIYIMGGTNDHDTYASVEVFELSMSSLYPIHDDYNVTFVESEDDHYYYSPKLLEHLCRDQMCRSLPDLDGEIPPNYPQHIITAILESLVSHGVPLNFIPFKAFKHYNLTTAAINHKRLLPSLSERISNIKRVKLF